MACLNWLSQLACLNWHVSIAMSLLEKKHESCVDNGTKTLPRNNTRHRIIIVQLKLQRVIVIYEKCKEPFLASIIAVIQQT